MRHTNPYAAATRRLARIDADWARLVRLVGPCTHEAKPVREPYEALVRAVAYQQLHVKAGDAIVARLLALFPRAEFPSPEALLAAPPDRVRACGFSARKVDTIRGIAQGSLSGLVPGRAAADAMPDEALVERLTTLRGIGRWTVEMLLIYTLERMDVLPADDFGVRDGYRRWKGLTKTPTRGEIEALGTAWSPDRTVASWYLWRVPRGPGSTRAFSPRSVPP